MLKMVDGTGIIGVDMICPLGVSTPQPPNYDRVELEGVGMLVLPNSLDAPLERLELGGKTEQLNTRGVNLWRSDSTVIVSGTKYLMFDNPIQTGTYTLSAIFANDKSASESLFAFYNEQNQNVGGGTIKQGGRQSKTFTLTGKAVKVLFYASSGHDSSQGVTTTIKEMQLETGTTATTYEPYTGGKPSPSPEYPQEIKSVGKWNDEKQKYEVDVKVSNCGYLQKGSYADKIRPLPLEKGKTYRIYVDVKSAVVNVGILNEERTFANSVQLYAYYNSRGYPISSTGVVSGICRLPNSLYRGYTFTVTVDGLFLYQGVNANILNTDNAYVAYDFIKKVDISSPYTEKESVVLTSDRPITKWDKLVEQDGQIGWLYQSSKMILDGTKIKWLHSNKPENSYFATTIIDAYGGKGASFCKTYRNIQDPAYDIKYANERCIYSDHPTYTSGDKFFRAPNENVTTLEQWKEFIDENPIEMLYHTKNSEFVPLPQSEQDAVRNLKTYYPTTVITVDGGELDPDIKVTYRKEI